MNTVFQNNYNIAQHRTLEERREAAKLLLLRHPPAQVMVDLMDNAANIAYGAFPERLCIIQAGKVAYEGGLGPNYYKPEDIHDWLTNWRGSLS